MSHDQPTSTELELPMTSHKVIAAVAEKELCLLDNWHNSTLNSYIKEYKWSGLLTTGRRSCPPPSDESIIVIPDRYCTLACCSSKCSKLPSWCFFCCTIVGNILVGFIISQQYSSACFIPIRLWNRDLIIICMTSRDLSKRVRTLDTEKTALELRVPYLSTMV